MYITVHVCVCVWISVNGDSNLEWKISNAVGGLFEAVMFLLPLFLVYRVVMLSVLVFCLYVSVSVCMSGHTVCLSVRLSVCICRCLC